MAKALTVKYDRSFPLDQNMREGFGVTLSLDANDTVESALRAARRMVRDARVSSEAERKAGTDTSASAPGLPTTEAARV